MGYMKFVSDIAKLITYTNFIQTVFVSVSYVFMCVPFLFLFLFIYLFFFLVCRAWRSYLEQLYANDGEHELQEAGDEDYVSDSLYRYDDALYYVLGSTLIIM